MRLQGKVALVTGGASGIGLATVRRFEAEGARVVAADLKLDGLERTPTLLPLLLDVADEQDWIAAVAAAEAEFGRLDILVNNAGIGVPGAIVDLSLSDWRKVMAVNLDGVFLGIKHAVPAMKRAGGGSIVNISSMLGHVAVANASAYCASKGGVALLTRAAALEMAADGGKVRVNSVHPGYIETPLLQASLAREPARRDRITGQTPIGHLGRVEDVASAILYLASDEAAFVTGTGLVIDGGYTAQ
jgi:NAD(P)-dependent dehydrogenase (short-subunit alcohol dehydrogenase family)